MNRRSRNNSFSSSLSVPTGGSGVSSSNLTLCQSVPSPKDHSDTPLSGMFEPAHADAVLDLSMVRNEHHALLLSSGRDGIVNVWRSDWLVSDVTTLKK